jgi:hypothetical protein
MPLAPLTYYTKAPLPLPAVSVRYQCKNKTMAEAGVDHTEVAEMVETVAIKVAVVEDEVVAKYREEL